MAADDDALSTPTRVAFAGDWHANDYWSPRAIRYAKDLGADRIIHAGDFGTLFHQRFLRPTARALEETGLEILFVDGNHDDHRFLARQPQWPSGLRDVAPHIWYLPRGTRWTWNGIRFLALGGAHSVNSSMLRRDGGPWWPEERITKDQAAAVIAGGRADVMVTHDCPAGVHVPGLNDDDWPIHEIAAAHDHRRLLRTVVDEVRPSTLVHGHFHRRYTQDQDPADCVPGWPMRVHGLDCDATTLEGNIIVVDLEDLRPAETLEVSS